MKLKFFILSGWLFSVALTQPPFLFSQTREDCLSCHSDATLSTERNGRSVSLHVDDSVLAKSPHRKLVCVACHTRFTADDIPHKQKIDPVNCLSCHQNAPFNHTFHPQLAEAALAHQDPAVSCKDCHGTHDISPPGRPGSKFNSARLAESCGECHGDVTEHYSESAHGKAATGGVNGAPDCLTCHRQDLAGKDATHDTLANKITQEKLCLTCHLDNALVRAKTSPTAGFISSYETSVHGSALLDGNSAAANCVDCHGSHDMKRGSDPAALVHKNNLPQTCGKCHGDIASEFSASVHGEGLEKGVSEAPTCTTCHGEHTIYKHGDPRSPVADVNVSTQCTSCHGSVRLTFKYGVAGNRSESFSDSYHGLALKGGAVNVANCASCHGAHDIKASSDSTSRISKANLPSTCGKCHPGANQRFAVGSVHLAVTAEEEPTLYWIATVYVVLIVVTIGGMVLHNVLDFIKKSRRKIMIRRGVELAGHHGHSLYLRMTISERLQHGSLMVSFVLLVVTGFMLRYPDAWWVEGIRSVSSGTFEVRSLVHRIAALVMILASVVHVVYIFCANRGRSLLRDILPCRSDFNDAVSVVKYNLGLSWKKPKFGRFGYMEKMEYWTMVWGTMVMAVTGTIMWFDNTFIGVFTKLGYDISRTIHFYEAWLAMLGIVVWHLYYVVFNPDIYPMNLVWLSGKMSESEMAEDHPLELEKIRAHASMKTDSPDVSIVDGRGNDTVTEQVERNH